MKIAVAMIPVLLVARVLAADAPATTGPSDGSEHRYMIERTFPAGALDGLNADSKAKINATNAQYGVHWVMSYANAAKTKTYCVYEAPNEQAVREAAKANKIPVDSITEVPVTLSPK
jgi:Protein of unknown function (DUF4242)